MCDSLASCAGVRPIDELRLRWEFRKHGPWVTRFNIAGRTYGGDLSYQGDVRVKQFFDAFPDARTILEPGCLEGGMSFQLAQQPDSQVVALDARSENLERARFVQRIFGIENIDFIEADLELTPLASFGQFDAIFCSGLLYHLSRPWEFLDGLRPASSRVLLWTHYAHGDKVRDETDGFKGFWYQEHGVKDPRSGLNPRSFWMTLPDIVARLEENGFGRVEIIKDDPNHDPHACVTLAAWAV
jgi:SAM-dependent methyltransferase